MAERIDHGMTDADVAALPKGTVLHFTNWPGRKSVAVTLVNSRGAVTLPNGEELYAFADELSREPREGLGE